MTSQLLLSVNFSHGEININWQQESFWVVYKQGWMFLLNCQFHFANRPSMDMTRWFLHSSSLFLSNITSQRRSLVEIFLPWSMSFWILFLSSSHCKVRSCQWHRFSFASRYKSGNRSIGIIEEYWKLKFIFMVNLDTTGPIQSWKISLVSQAISQTIVSWWCPFFCFKKL